MGWTTNPQDNRGLKVVRIRDHLDIHYFTRTIKCTKHTTEETAEWTCGLGSKGETRSREDFSPTRPNTGEHSLSGALV